MNAVSSIVCSGRTGTIGRLLPPSVTSVQTRLEETESSMRAELSALFSRPDAFLHLAAMTLVADCERDPEKTHVINVEGPVKWLRACSQVGCRKFIQVSTCHVFKPRPSAELLTPDLIPDATTAYGRSKLEAELALTEAAKSLEVELTIARVFSVIGEGMRPGYLFPELQRRVRTRDFSPLPGYKNVRDFIEAKEVAKILYRLATESHAPGLYHICTGRPQSVRQLAEGLMRSQGLLERDFCAMFPETTDEANYLISDPTPILEGV
jgi:nucleoside-diphosphate-sugar epimerase